MGVITYFFVIGPSKPPGSALADCKGKPRAESAADRSAGNTAPRNRPRNRPRRQRRPNPPLPLSPQGPSRRKFRPNRKWLPNRNLVRAPRQAKVGQLMVSANVNGARISVDGQSDPSWLTPYTIPDLPAGAHNIVISMDGYDNFQQSVTIAGGQTSNVAGNLSSPRAEVDIITVPPGVEVLIDGKSYGPSPVRATLAPGNHTYTVKLPGMAPY